MLQCAHPSRGLAVNKTERCALFDHGCVSSDPDITSGVRFSLPWASNQHSRYDREMGDGVAEGDVTDHISHQKAGHESGKLPVSSITPLLTHFPSSPATLAFYFSILC